VTLSRSVFGLGRADLGRYWMRQRYMCADQILERYLVAGTLPPNGTTCPPGIVPFT
jgi:hypothetical protein